MSKRYITCAETAKLIRAALKAAFPATTFSIRSKTYSGGASISVRWTDGPTQKAVEAITWRFQGASFDGMTDSKSYHDSVLNGETVHFQADYVFCSRMYSFALYRRIVAEVCVERGYAMPKIAGDDRTGPYIPNNHLLPRLDAWSNRTLMDIINERASERAA